MLFAAIHHGFYPCCVQKCGERPETLETTFAYRQGQIALSCRTFCLCLCRHIISAKSFVGRTLKRSRLRVQMLRNSVERVLFELFGAGNSCLVMLEVRLIRVDFVGWRMKTMGLKVLKCGFYLFFFDSFSSS